MFRRPLGDRKLCQTSHIYNLYHSRASTSMQISPGWGKNLEHVFTEHTTVPKEATTNRAGVSSSLKRKITFAQFVCETRWDKCQQCETTSPRTSTSKEMNTFVQSSEGNSNRVYQHISKRETWDVFLGTRGIPVSLFHSPHHYFHQTFICRRNKKQVCGSVDVSNKKVS